MPVGLAEASNVLGPLVMCLVGCMDVYVDDVAISGGPIAIFSDYISNVLSCGMSVLCMICRYVYM
jgi:hypothetical protein